MMCYAPYLSNLAHCSHEKADTHLFTHAADAADAVRKECRNLCVKTVDNNVVVLAILPLRRLTLMSCGWLLECEQIYDTYIYEVVTNMDPGICATLPMFHDCTGCDTVSAFCGRGKR